MSDEQKEQGERKEFVSFMVYRMESAQRDRFQKYCDAHGVNYAPGITMLLNDSERLAVVSQLASKIEELEKQLAKLTAEPKKAGRFGGD